MTDDILPDFNDWPLSLSDLRLLVDAIRRNKLRVTGDGELTEGDGGAHLFINPQPQVALVQVTGFQDEDGYYPGEIYIWDDTDGYQKTEDCLVLA